MAPTKAECLSVGGCVKWISGVEVSADECEIKGLVSLAGEMNEQGWCIKRSE